MFRALLKKQMMEVNTWLIQDKKSGKRRSSGRMVFLVIVYVILFGIIGSMFFGLGRSMCDVLCTLELGWLYFTVMSMLSVVMGVFGSVFNTFTTLYEAKDNELLLSMPIKPSYILTARVLGVYLWSFIYTALAFIPSAAVYLIYGKFSAASLICSILLLVILSVFVLSLSCVLGWVVAKISGKLKNKSFITVIVSVAFIAIYYFVYFKAMELVQNFLNNALTIGAVIKGKALPVYWMGSAGTGDFLSLLYVFAIVGVIISLTLYVMSRSFIKMATTNKGAVRRVYKRERAKCKSVGAALFVKELRRYVSSANYMLNCSLGTLFLPILGVAALVKSDTVRSAVNAFGIHGDIVLMMVCASLCGLASFNDITSPSVSLEGKNLWIVKSLPVEPWKVLAAKLKLHLLLTEIPVVFCSVCICIAMGFDVTKSVICTVIPMLYAVFMAEFGLLLNLKMPNLTWTNEIVPIKQSASVTIALFGGWAVIIVLAVIYYLTSEYISEYVYLAICTAAFAASGAGLALWLKQRGTRIFERL